MALYATHPHAGGAERGHTQFEETGGRSARLARYVDNCRVLIDGMAALGFKPLLRPEVQAPIIVTFHAPAHPGYEFRRFYEAAKARGFILYPGKLTQVETFASAASAPSAAMKCGRPWRPWPMRCAKWALPMRRLHRTAGASPATEPTPLQAVEPRKAMM